MNDNPPPKKKKSPDKQHAVKGASWRRFAAGVRAAAKGVHEWNQDVLIALNAVADAAEDEAKRVSGLR